jgi:hypothetical protein
MGATKHNTYNYSMNITTTDHFTHHTSHHENLQHGISIFSQNKKW